MSHRSEVLEHPFVRLHKLDHMLDVVVERPCQRRVLFETRLNGPSVRVDRCDSYTCSTPSVTDIGGDAVSQFMDGSTRKTDQPDLGGLQTALVYQPSDASARGRRLASTRTSINQDACTRVRADDFRL